MVCIGPFHDFDAVLTGGVGGWGWAGVWGQTPAEITANVWDFGRL